MPDNPHSKKLAFERDLMEQTGLTRGQVRRALFEFDKTERAKADRERTQFTEPVKDQPSRTAITTSETKFEPKPFREAPTAPQGAGALFGSRIPALDVIEIIDAVPEWIRYTDIPAGGREQLS